MAKEFDWEKMPTPQPSPEGSVSIFERLYPKLAVRKVRGLPQWALRQEFGEVVWVVRHEPCGDVDVVFVKRGTMVREWELAGVTDEEVVDFVKKHR